LLALPFLFPDLPGFVIKIGKGWIIILHKIPVVEWLRARDWHQTLLDIGVSRLEGRLGGSVGEASAFQVPP